MKKKGVILNVLLTVIILFPILFQVVHIYEHHSEQNQNKQEVVTYSNNENQLTADQTVSDNCFVCDYKFTVHTVGSIAIYTFFIGCFIAATLLFYSPKPVAFYAGSLFSLRAPPQF